MLIPCDTNFIFVIRLRDCIGTHCITAGNRHSHREQGEKGQSRQQPQQSANVKRELPAVVGAHSPHLMPDAAAAIRNSPVKNGS